MTNWNKVHDIAGQLFDETRDIYRPDFTGNVFEHARIARALFEALLKEMRK